MEIENQKEPIKRPVFLVVLSVFSLISISSGLLSSILGLISGPMQDYQVDEIIGQNMAGVTQLQEMGEVYWSEITLKILNLIKYTNENFYMDRLINFGAYAIGLNGVIFMLKGRKLGFHLYIVYNLIALISIYASAPASEIPSFYFILFGIISSVFIFMFSRNLILGIVFIKE
jgi:hypothetical protein